MGILFVVVPENFVTMLKLKKHIANVGINWDGNFYKFVDNTVYEKRNRINKL